MKKMVALEEYKEKQKIINVWFNTFECYIKT